MIILFTVMLLQALVLLASYFEILPSRFGFLIFFGLALLVSASMVFDVFRWQGQVLVFVTKSLQLAPLVWMSMLLVGSGMGNDYVTSGIEFESREDLLEALVISNEPPPSDLPSGPMVPSRLELPADVGSVATYLKEQLSQDVSHLVLLEHQDLGSLQRFHFVAISPMFKFKDDLVIVIEKGAFGENGGTSVYMRSKSREGKSDFGANVKRLFMIQATLLKVFRQIDPNLKHQHRQSHL